MRNTGRSIAILPVLLTGLCLGPVGCGKGQPAWTQRLLAERSERRIDLLGDRIDVLRRSSDARTRLGADSCYAQAAYLRYRISVQLEKDLRAWSGIRGEIAALARDTATLENGEDLVARRRGVFLQGYRSRIDGSVQPYSISVPDQYTGEKPFPLVIRLHGHGGFQPFQGHPVEAMSGAISVAPHGRGPSDYMGVGEDDVLQVIAHVRRSHWIDGDRIYVIGYSMGGTGCWAMACRHPELFAGIVPIAGNADHRVWEREWLWKRQGEFAELRGFLRAADSPVTFAANMLNVPAICIHGGGDTVVPPGHARSMVAALRAAGGNVRYLEFPGSGHGRFPADVAQLALAEAASYARDPLPRKVHVTAENLRHGRAHWVEIASIERPCRLASVTAELARNPARITLTASNVNSVVLHLDDSMTGDGNPVSVVWNGREAYHGILPAKGGEPPVIEDPARPKTAARALVKRKGLEGPVADVFLDPFVIVRGSGECPTGLREIEEREIGHFCDEWERRYGAKPRVKADTEIGADDIREMHLVIFGGPAGNSVYESIAPRLPITVDPREQTVTCAGETYSGPDVGSIFCYPNPANPRRLVAVFAGVSPEALFQINSRFGNWFDWGIFDGRKWFDYAVFDARTAGPESYLAVGFFGCDWSFGRGRRWAGSETARRATPRMRMPSAVVPGGERTPLSALMPAKIDQMRGAVGFDRSFRGNNIMLGNRTYTGGLGVRAPSTITYRLPRGFRRLTAVVGLDVDGDDEIASARWAKEKARFVVEGDGDVLFETKDPVSWKKNARVISVDIRGVSELVLRVEPAGGPVWLQGSSAWGDAWLEK